MPLSDWTADQVFEINVYSIKAVKTLNFEALSFIRKYVIFKNNVLPHIIA